jgi:signal transduction histidine kinase
LQKRISFFPETLFRYPFLTVSDPHLGRTSHDLCNPLGAIKNAANLIDIALENPDPEVKEAIGHIRHEVEASELILRDLMDFSENTTPFIGKVDIDMFIGPTLTRVSIPENVRITRKAEEGLRNVTADRDNLKAIFHNVVLSAVQSMPKGGEPTIRMKNPYPAMVTVEVGDTGKGISEQNMKRLFYPLFTTKARGIVLGLPGAKSCVEKQGGSIGVKSKDGKGYTFIVTLQTKASGEKI